MRTLSATPGFRAMSSDVRRLLVAHGLSATAMGLPWPAILVAVWEQSHSDLALGLAGAARMAPYVALSWLAGRLADRYARGLMVKLSLVLRLGFLALTAVSLAGGFVGLAVVSACLVVACGTPAYPALAAEMPRLAGPANEVATGLLVTLEVAAFFVGPALGGLALSLGIGAGACWLGLLFTAAALWLVLGVGWAREAAVKRNEGHRHERHVGVVEVLRRQPVAIKAVVAVVINNAVLGAVSIALLPLAEQAWDGGAVEFGLATAAIGIGAVAAPVLLRVWGLRCTAGQRSSYVLAGFLVATIVSPHLWWAFLPLAIAGAAAVHVEAVATGLIQQATPDSARSSVLGMADSLMVAAGALGAAVTPWLTAQVDVRAVVAACAFAALSMVLLFRRDPGSYAVAVSAHGGLQPDRHEVTLALVD